VFAGKEQNALTPFIPVKVRVTPAELVVIFNPLCCGMNGCMVTPFLVVNVAPGVNPAACVVPL
jgi:hypothetical protein